MKKFTVFRSKYPLISSLYKQGYTQVEIVEKLKLEHGLDLTVGTFKVYLHRAKKLDNLNEHNVEKTGIESNVGEHNQDDNVHKISNSLTPSTNESNDSSKDDKPDELPKTQQVFNNRQKGQMFIQKLLNEDN